MLLNFSILYFIYINFCTILCFYVLDFSIYLNVCDYFLYILCEHRWREPGNKNFSANECFIVTVVHMTNKELNYT